MARISRSSVFFALFLGLLGRGLPAVTVHAQDIRDVVREHLDENLEPKKPKASRTDSELHVRDAPAPTPAPPPPPPVEPVAPAPPPVPVEPAVAPPGPAAPAEGASWSFSTSSASNEPAPPPDPNAPKLPIRVIGKYLKLDVTLGGGYRGWLPQQYKNVPVKVGTYYVWTVEVKAKLFNFLNLHRGYYESNALSAPSNDRAAVAEQVGSYVPKAAWLLGVLGLPLFKAWEPIIRYESRAFQTQARPEEPVCLVDDRVASDLSACPRSTARLSMRSGFETVVGGVRYDSSKSPSAVLEPHHRQKLPPITFGVGLMSYRKPYQVNVDGNTLEGYLFDGRFRGAGLMLGVDVAGAPDRVFFRADAQVGVGEVKLTKKLSLNSLAPDDWFMGYVQGNVTLGYYLPVYRRIPTLMFVPQTTLGGASFFLFDTEQKESERGKASSVNWDFLWSVHAALTISL